MQAELSFATPSFEDNNGHGIAAVVKLRKMIALDEALTPEIGMYAVSERSRTASVYDAHGGKVGEQRVVEILVQLGACLIDIFAYEIDLGRDARRLHGAVK